MRRKTTLLWIRPSIVNPRGPLSERPRQKPSLQRKQLFDQKPANDAELFFKMRGN